MEGDLTSSVRRNYYYYIDSNIPFKHCIQSIVIHVRVESFFLKFTQHIATTKTDSNQEAAKKQMICTLLSTQKVHVWAFINKMYVCNE